MKIANITEIAVVVLLGALAFSSVATAAPSSRECWSMANTVKAALDKNPNASQDAWAHYRTGTEACTNGFTALGISNFKEAMKALGG